MGDPTSFTFLWPTMLWLLLALPLLVLAYRSVLKRRGALAARHARLETVGGAATSRLQRALPPLLWLAGLAAMILAVARPQAALVLPARIETVILALDMSGSMRATDIEPTRLVAAQAAAKSFVDGQPRHVKIGVVGIAASAALVQSPTDNREDILKSIERLEPQRGTALGSGLAIALDAALPQARINVEQFINPPKGRKDEPRKKLEEREMTAGSNTAAAIVLLSDGQSNVGPEPLKAAELAAGYGVRIYTVGMGTPEGTTVSADGWQMRVRLDEETLKQVARVTEGEYFRAPDAKELKKIYGALSARLAFEKQQPTEITGLFAAFGALLVGLGAALSMLWFNRVL
ncbi:MAG: VWA domain-containing protein [Sphingomonadaceae bacterium]